MKTYTPEHEAKILAAKALLGERYLLHPVHKVQKRPLPPLPHIPEMLRA